MWKRGMGWILPGMVIWAGSLAWADTPIQSPNPSPANPVANANPRAPGKAGSAPASMAPRPPTLPSASVSASASQPGNTQGASAPPSTPAAAAVKTALADAFIAQSVLRIYLERPAAVSVFNSRGQLMFHVDSRRELETMPLQGISTGFIYLVVRTAQGELTRKLVYTGK